MYVRRHPQPPSPFEKPSETDFLFNIRDVQGGDDACNLALSRSSSDLNALIERVKDKTGIVAAHLASLQQLAQDHRCIIGIRPVEKIATQLIEDGHPTKSLHIKGKSASWGPQAGLICVNQRYSKLENSPDEHIDTFSAKTYQCIASGDAVAVPLTLSSSRLNSLLQKGVIDNLSPERSSGSVTFSAKALSRRTYSFEGKKSVSEDGYRITHEGQAIEVLAPRAGAKPLTADYDLFVVAPRIDEMGPQDNLPVPDVAHSVFRKRLNQYTKTPSTATLIRGFNNAESFYEKQDREIGNASERVRQLIPLINQTLVGCGEPVVHHGADSANPATDPSSNYPITFVLPEKSGRFDKICVIENSRELKEFVQQAKNNGYHVPLNPLWEEEVKSVRRSNFNKASEAVGAKLSVRRCL